ncbi:MAG: hypothetical protein Kow0077_23030 [Anaerolineae bacterium]
MFDPTSRYADLEDAEHTLPDGRVVRYKRRRFLPRPESLDTLVVVRVQQGQRTDHIAAATLGDPLQFWRLLDANLALHPVELTETVNRPVRVPIPRPPGEIT